MPDYAACTQATCPRRHECARYRMLWNPWGQTVGHHTPGPQCPRFWPADEAPWGLVTPVEADARASQKEEPG